MSKITKLKCFNVRWGCNSETPQKKLVTSIWIKDIMLLKKNKFFEDHTINVILCSSNLIFCKGENIFIHFHFYDQIIYLEEKKT